MRLHSGAADDYERVRAGGPGFIGSKILKHSNQAVFRIATGRKCTSLQVQGVSQDMQGVARRLGLAGMITWGRGVSNFCSGAAYMRKGAEAFQAGEFRFYQRDQQLVQ